MDCTWDISYFLSYGHQVPEELLQIVQYGSNQEFLNTLSAAALKQNFSEIIFAHFEPFSLELCSRWVSRDLSAVAVAFARILPVLPHLSDVAQRILSSHADVDLLSGMEDEDDENCRDRNRILLLAIFRLLNFDNETFARFIRPAKLQFFLQHDDRSLRYLAIRVISQYIHASDAVLHDMIRRYLGSDSASGKCDEATIDFRFLSLWENKRLVELSNRVGSIRQLRKSATNSNKPLRIIREDDLSNRVALVSDILLHRGSEISAASDHGQHLVPTSTTISNLRRISGVLAGPEPLLLTGLAGCGKTFLIKYVAEKLNKSASMITLHLNEQSDAKLLVGIYSTGVQPGSFEWQPGVLTTAVTEGRWVLIEDLDRAPNGVMSTILPLIERRELSIPSRGQKLIAAPGFKIIATMRSTINLRGDLYAPTERTLGKRLWTMVPLDAPSVDELREIILVQYPVLKRFIDQIMDVYRQLCNGTVLRDGVSKTQAMKRPTSPRELLKWADRINAIVSSGGSREGHESIPEDAMDSIFLDAVDCFAGHLEDGLLRASWISIIAKELHIDPQRKQYLVANRSVTFRRYKGNSRNTLRIGRAILTTRTANRNVLSKQSSFTFAMNGYSLRLLERVTAATERREPLLLVGETGIGKTAVVQHLAHLTANKLIAINLSQQSEAGDLLGGFKPVNFRSMAIPLKDEFDSIFERVFSQRKNQEFSEQLSRYIVKGQWKRAVTLWKTAFKKLEGSLQSNGHESSGTASNNEQQAKRRKIHPKPSPEIITQLQGFSKKLASFEHQLLGPSNSFRFSYMEGKLITAVREGHWVLLDEINMATSDTLECLSELLDSGPNARPSIVLAETGDVERIMAHPNFRVFAAMNPANDVGKKDLPLGIRSRFTEIFVDSPDGDFQSLRDIAKACIERLSTGNASLELANKVAELFQQIQTITKEEGLVDGSGQVAHFSLRTLTRALAHANVVAPQCTARRAIYEGFCLCFFTCLDAKCEARLQQLVKSKLFIDSTTAKSELKKSLRPPAPEEEFIPIVLHAEAVGKSKRREEEMHWLPKGGLPAENPTHYILTPYVNYNLQNLIRAAFTRKYPVLIQGPTSAGKTSMIEYLAKRSGNKFIRINNHEHTDLQEYLGTYVSTPDGTLVFQEGLLVQAVRQGHWIVLDELNLAPTDVLEALNRLLDDNQELFIPETQEVVRAHRNFILFATQNPAGPYGGRKMLSRAFRNRFVELHFNDIPVEELNIILARRSNLPESWCGLIVEVYKQLSTLRQEQRLFEENSFATLRDLFRWAFRGADNLHQLAIQGYMLLAEKVRKADERHSIKAIIERTMSRKGVKVQIDDNVLYAYDICPEMRMYDQSFRGNILWTKAMRRLFILVSHAIRHNEPVLLVGETGCGKTTVCQMLAKVSSKDLKIVNAHQNTETGDLIGAQRPIRNRSSVNDDLLRDLITCIPNFNQHSEHSVMNIDSMLEEFDALSGEEIDALTPTVLSRIATNRVKRKVLFEWSDGSLVQAMRSGSYYLLDEISLAEDSVLERMNSVLDPQRNLLLAEKGLDDSFVVAQDGFQFFATMNPGGDFGKKELSPALRNRFTEIWVPPLSDVDDVLQIVEAKLSAGAKAYAAGMVEFAKWFSERYNSLKVSSISIRDLLAWIDFINSQPMQAISSVAHGAAMVYIDTLGANPSGILEIARDRLDLERSQCIQYLSHSLGQDIEFVFAESLDLRLTETALQIGHFSINVICEAPPGPIFHFETPTTKLNAMRILRALQVSKPILLEGSPGVGKTSIITAVANIVGQGLIRINLSDQTDLMDLFGSDVPAENENAGTFEWRDAPFLTAMKRGDWVLLDEMNLASQSVLEGLNACLDHRGEAYVAELDQTFVRHPEFRLFAAQNPHHQGGGRKGLPASFINRFTVVYIDEFKPEDLQLICSRVFPGDISSKSMEQLIAFVTKLGWLTTGARHFGSRGAPWEFNLRDILRWLQLLASQKGLLSAGTAGDFYDMLFAQRFRTDNDVHKARETFSFIFEQNLPERNFFTNISPNTAQIGLALLSRQDPLCESTSLYNFMLKPRLPLMESLMLCVQQNWPVILVGQSGAGKSSILRAIASISGAEMDVFALNADIDATDLVGGFEQVDNSRHIQALLNKVSRFCLAESRRLLLHESKPHFWSKFGPLFHLYSQVKVAAYDQVSLSLLHQTFIQYSALMPSNEATSIDQQFQSLLSGPRMEGAASFEWVDGTLVKALESGRWLLLDNANLCSSSVLDRINSLLEPDGSLIVNERCHVDGTAKLVRPHPNFRIFMTVDPQFGELSRAMRNRAVELFVAPLPADVLDLHTDIASYMTFEPSATGFQDILNLHSALSRTRSTVALMENASERLSSSTINSWPAFAQEASSGLIDDRAEVFETVSNKLQLFDENYGAKSLHYYEVLNSKLNLGIDFPLAQPSHILVNEHLIGYGRVLVPQFDPVQLGKLQDILLDLATMKRAFIVSTSSTTITKQATRLQRSFSATRNMNLSNESTLWAAEFLQNVQRAIGEWVTTTRIEDIVQPSFLQVVSQIRSFWWIIFFLVSSADFEEARFRTVLMLGTEVVATARPDTDRESSLVEHVLTQFDGFGKAINLTTGLSMESLWTLFRPPTLPNVERLQSLLQLEKVADTFDEIVWQFRAPFEDIVALQLSIMHAIELVYEQEVSATSISKDLNDTISNLRVEEKHEGVQIRPFFHRAFEYLRQHLDVQIAENLHRTKISRQKSQQLHFLASRSTKDVGITPKAFTIESKLARLSKFMQPSASADSANKSIGNWSSDLLQQLQNWGDVPLRGLDLLQVEANVLGTELARNADTLSTVAMTSLFSILSELAEAVLFEHKELLNSEFVEQVATRGLQLVLIELARQEIPLSHFLCLANSKAGLQQQNLILNLIKPFYSAALGTNYDAVRALSVLSDCFIGFSLVSLLLYVPDKEWDPVLRETVEYEICEQRKQHLRDKCNSYAQLEDFFTGRASNLRLRICEEELQELEELDISSSVLEIARPQRSQIHKVQLEFDRVVGLVKPLFDSWSDGQIQNLQETALTGNISAMINRLSNSLDEYRDLTVPAIRFLQCLRTGLSLSILAKDQNTAPDGVLPSLFDVPFLCSLPGLWVPYRPVITIYNDSLSLRLSPKLRILILRSYAFRSTLQAPEAWPTEMQNDLAAVLASLFGEWKSQLAADRTKMEAESSFYRYRGAPEDEDEAQEQEFNDLFPRFEGGVDSSRSKLDTTDNHLPQKFVSIVAGLLAIIFFKSEERERPLKQLRAMIDYAARIESADQSPKPASSEMFDAKKILPTLFLQIQSLNLDLRSTIKASELYNVYVDSNLHEAKRLCSLVYEVQARVHSIVQIWPEHATLHDILAICEEVLNFRHVEPIMKFLTKAEQLHGSIAEWQSVTSREYSAEHVFNNLTDILVSWRKLELSTWAKLLDIETERCNKDAQTWWFIAYENVCAIPESLEESPEVMQSHAAELISTLESFLLASSLGQFQAKLQILASLQALNSLSVDRNLSMRSICSALGNFVRHYSRFIPIVSEKIAQGRRNLEKKLKDVLQLASWNDRNVEALKQSAKKSHRKLFQIIRKYRELLSQPVSGIFEDKTSLAETTNQKSDLNPVSDVSSLTRALSAAAIYQLDEMDWKSLPQRFKNIAVTVSAMQDMASLAGAVELSKPAARLESFVDSLEASMRHLKQTTPPTLTEDNTPLVKHLLTRKRRLFADTLKEIRQMGMTSNPSLDVLARQNSLGSILSRMLIIPTDYASEAALSARDILHSTVDLMSSVRQATVDHHEDLNKNDLSRSVGFVESLLALNLRQFNVFSTCATQFQTLESLIDQSSHLWSDDGPSIHPKFRSKDMQLTYLGQITMWLPTITRLCAEMLSAQADLGGFDLSEIIDGLLERADGFDGLYQRYSKLSSLPPCILGSEHAIFLEHCDSAIDSFVDFLTQTYEDEVKQKASVVLDQLLSWIQLHSLPNTSDSDHSQEYNEIESVAFDQALFHVADLVLGAIQDVAKVTQSITMAEDMEKNWLVHHVQDLDSLIKAFHLPIITQSLQNVLPLIYRAGLSESGYNENRLHHASALVTLVLPIFQKYQQLVHEAIEIFAVLHRATSRATYRLAKTFTVVATQGFCKPAEKSGERGSASDKLESGTGLGEGEGEEDISKDIGDDEDLSELAQDPGNPSEKEGVKRNEDDAVEIEDALQGSAVDDAGKEEEDADGQSENGESVSEVGSQNGSVGSGEGGKDDKAAETQDDEVGDVDDLGPSAVDEKLWEQAADEKKTKEGKQSSKNVDEDDQAAAADEDNGKKRTEENEGVGQDEEGDDDRMSDAEMSEDSDAESIQGDGVMDPHVKETEVFELPEDLQLDGDKNHHDDIESDDAEADNLDDVSMDEANDDEVVAQNHDNKSDLMDEDFPPDLDTAEEAQPQGNDGMERNEEGDEINLDSETKPDEGNSFEDQDAADTNNELGSGIANNVPQDQLDASKPESSAQRQTGVESQPSNQSQDTGAEGVNKGKQNEPRDSRDKQTIKKLGNMLEEWHRQQREIRNASSTEQEKPIDGDDVDMADADFEHLPHDDAQTDTQAIGGATEEQARALDESMAISSTEKEANDSPKEFPPDLEDNSNDLNGDTEMRDEKPTSKDQPVTDSQELPGAFVGERKEAALDPMADKSEPHELEQVDDQLSEMRLQPLEDSSSRDTSTEPSSNDPLVLWHHHESRTHALSLALTSHLRLILAPTLATKLRGDFRTGKRLNIKRIIPYIASSYKRDKIWMRRSVPTKRAYQVMLAIDDSRSMVETSAPNSRGNGPSVEREDQSNSKDMAFDTLALISRGLSMLDVGDVSVVGFGEHVFVAHDFGSPITSEAGAEILRRFTFQQQKTDVRRLIQESIKIFREARARSTSSGSAELWQLQLIVSDGICEDHEGIRRLLLEAREERIMIVFVLVDALANNAPGNGKGQGQSIVDLERVEFVQESSVEGQGDGEGEMKLVRTKYLESFPFSYYLVVKDVQELPHVLATALRQWFAEVAER